MCCLKLQVVGLRFPTTEAKTLVANFFLCSASLFLWAYNSACRGFQVVTQFYCWLEKKAAEVRLGHDCDGCGIVRPADCNIPVTVNLVYLRTALFLSAFLVISNSVIVKVSAATNHSDLKNIVPRPIQLFS